MKKRKFAWLKSILTISFTCLLLFFVQAQTEDYTPPPVPQPEGTDDWCGFRDDYGNWVGVSWKKPPYGSDTTGDVYFYRFNTGTSTWENTGSGTGFSQTSLWRYYCGIPDPVTNMN